MEAEKNGFQKRIYQAVRRKGIQRTLQKEARFNTNEYRDQGNENRKDVFQKAEAQKRVGVNISRSFCLFPHKSDILFTKSGIS